jgi:hypothetical protein
MRLHIGAIGGPITMLRLARISLLGGLVVLAAASASSQTPTSSPELGVCPGGAITIYYARGDAAPSQVARDLIGRVSEEARSCSPEGIDLVADISIDSEGDAAIALAMARLGGVAEALVAQGYPADRIRMAAHGGGETRAPMGEITILFRKAPQAGSAVAAPAGARNPSRDAI